MRTIPTMPLWRFDVRRLSYGHQHCYRIGLVRGGIDIAWFYTDTHGGDPSYGVRYLRRCARAWMRRKRIA